MKINRFKLNKSNPRTIDKEKLELLKKSIQDFPQMLSKRPIVCVTDEQDGKIYPLGGNMRLKALIELGFKEIEDSWVQMADDFTEEQRKEFLIKDNLAFGKWDYDIFRQEWDLEKLEEWGIDLQELEEEEEKQEIKEDYFEDTASETITVLGDLYEIGEHRLLCGDSIDSEQVAKLMNEKKADMVFTDPPYDLENEDYNVNIFLFTENAHVFVMHDDKGLVNYLRASKLDFSRFYVANFGFSSPRGNDPYLSHILISQEKKGNAIPHKNMHDGFRSIIPLEYRFRLKDDKTEHKHQKPIKFIATFIEHFSNEKAIVLDLFLGSGSTMVASHQLKRKCYGMELDPKYCDLIIRRMLTLDSKLKIKRNGIEIKADLFIQSTNN